MYELISVILVLQLMLYVRMTFSWSAKIFNFIPKGLALFLALMLLANPASASAETKPQPAEATPQPAAATNIIPLLPAEEFKRQEEWRNAITTKPQPKKGCFTAKFPSLEWQEIPCVNGPKYPMPPRSGIVPETVGNGDDIAAQAPSGIISSAIGSFDTLTNVTSESGPIGNAGASLPDTYTLQINTDFFPTTVCSASPNPGGCNGWEQFVFENNPSAHRAFIQYWLINFDTTCPANFQPFPVGGGHTDCVQLTNLSGAVPTPPVPVTNLGQVTLTGAASAGADSITMTIGGTAFSRVGDNSVNASSGWRIAEFNIFGDGGNNKGGGTATFNNNASLVTRIRINSGSNAAPICVAQGFTGEKNNLSFGPSAPVGSQPGPALIFTESTAGGAPANCAASTSVGDTHLTTLSGLLYDFQATGDFELLETKSGFVVQNRQVSGAPNWPNASVNSAIAAQLGKTKVAVCLAPQRVVVDGKPLPLRQGQVELLTDGTQISFRGNSYLLRGASGDWVKANVNTNYIDVSVGLGRWPIEAQGLLVNAKSDPNQVATREGTVLNIPFSFEEFYHRYGESWRVKPAESMLNVCGEAKESGLPAKPFYAKDLDPQIAKRVEAICREAGVKGPLLDACMIDVAFTGKESAARIHARTRQPVAVGVIK
jgi:hypothetical protein